MIGALLAINIGLSFIILLATSMIQNHFKRMDRSMRIYADKKMYKPKSDIIFLNSLLEKYQVISGYNKNNIDIQMMVHKALCEESIGKFKYTRVQSIVTKGKFVMWSILMTQIGLQLLKGVTSYSKVSFVMILANSLLCMLLTLVSVIKSIPEEREKLIVKLADYIVNTYPAEVEWQKGQQSIKELTLEVEQLKEKLHSYKSVEAENNIDSIEKDIKQEEDLEDILQAKDIINLLDKINLTI